MYIPVVSDKLLQHAVSSKRQDGPDIDERIAVEIAIACRLNNYILSFPIAP
jgi:hypothetical protein